MPLAPLPGESNLYDISRIKQMGGGGGGGGRGGLYALKQTFVEVFVSSFGGHDPSSGSSEKASEKTCHHLHNSCTISFGGAQQTA